MHFLHFEKLHSPLFAFYTLKKLYPPLFTFQIFLEMSDDLQKRLFIWNGILMSGTALVIRCIGMLFRIFLSDRLGAEGIGVYQLVLSVYFVFVSVAASGVSLCTTRLFGEYSALGHCAKARYCVEKSAAAAFIFGTALGACMYFTSDASAQYVLSEERAAAALRLLAPSLPFLAVSACIRGYFCARRKTLQVSGEQLLEQLIEIGVFALLFSIQRPVDLAQACCTTVIGTTAAEIVSFVYSILCYRADIRNYCKEKEKVQGMYRKMLPIALPVTANACTRSGLSAAENALVPYGLKRFGNSGSQALAQYGTVSGMSLPVLTFPSVFIIPFASLIIPEIAEARVKQHKNGIKHITEKMLRLTLLYSIPVTVLFIFYAIPLCRVLFGSDDAGKFLVLLAPVVPFMYLDSVVDAVLKGLDEQTSYFVFNAIDSVIRVALTYILLPFYGIYGVIAVITISELLNTLMSMWRLIKVTKLRISIGNDIILPLLTILLPCLLINIVPRISDIEILDTGVRITTAIIVYCFMIMTLGHPRENYIIKKKPTA